MGCDIHNYVEVKVNGKWKPIYKPVKHKEYSWTEDAYAYNNRNYDLFAILANVRNGRGFAGCKTGDGFVPISMPKGLPDDISYEVKEQAESWDGDGHSHSFLTVKELLAYNWKGQTTTKQGIVSEEGYKAWKESGNLYPFEWSDGIGGPNIITIPEEVYINKEYSKGTDVKLYISARWQVQYSDAVSSFIENQLENMKQLAEEYGGPENVRMVFWFDN